MNIEELIAISTKLLNEKEEDEQKILTLRVRIEELEKQLANRSVSIDAKPKSDFDEALVYAFSQCMISKEEMLKQLDINMNDIENDLKFSNSGLWAGLGHWENEVVTFNKK